MDYKNVFFGILIAFVITTAFTLFAVNLNSNYGGMSGAGTVDTGFMSESGLDEVEAFAGGMSTSVANSTNPPSVSSENELTQSKNTFSLIRSMVDFVPNLLRSIGAIFGIPKVYTNAAAWAFAFSFGITLAYLLILGVRKIL